MLDSRLSKIYQTTFYCGATGVKKDPLIAVSDREELLCTRQCRKISASFMEKSRANEQTDFALLPFLKSVSEKEADDALEILLVRQVQPTIEKTLRAKMHVSLKPDDFAQANQDGLELLSEVKLLLISELGKLKSGGKIIQNLNNYVVSVTLNAYRQHLRSKYPWRQHLKNKLRYLLTHHPKFALRETEQGWLGGFRQDKKFEPPPDAETIQAGIAETVNRNDLRENSRIIDLLTAIFEFAKVPVFFNDLLAVVAEVQGIKDWEEVSEAENFLSFSEDKTLNEIEQREYLKTIWTEICALPVRHRLALLLNFKDRQGDCVIRLLPFLRIASIRQIAATLEFAPEDFASVWNELPWDDLKIAEYLNLTRQQVINLRQSARARLLRQSKNM